MITTRINTNTKFILAEYYGQTNQLKTTPLQYEIIKKDTVLARFTTREEMNNALSHFAESKPKQQMFLIINSTNFTKDKRNNNFYNVKIPVTLTGNKKHIQNELHYEVIINGELHYVSEYSLTDSN